MKKLQTCLFAGLIGVGLLPSMAQAILPYSPVGQWTLTFYGEVKGTKHSSAGICMLEDGSFYSDTFATWMGYWHVYGNQISLDGHYWTNHWSTSFSGEKISNSLLTGRFAEQPIDDVPDYAVVTLVKDGTVCNPMPTGVMQNTQTLTGVPLR